jgi:surfactin synthase thioesterase subunit
MSKRRGKILTDPESVERRKWYSDLQKATIDEVAKENEFFKEQRYRELHAQEARTPAKERAEITTTDSPWIHSLNSPKGKSATVICFPGISQSPAVYQKWCKPFSDSDIYLCAVCLPGRSNRAAEEFATSITEVVVAVFLALKNMYVLEKKPHEEDTATANRPLVFFGHDMGCLVAYEIAKLLQDYHYTFTALVASSCPSPYQQGQNRYGKKHCFLSDKELMQRMAELGGVPDVLRGRKDILNYFLLLFRSDYYLYDKYEIRPPATVLTIPEAEIGNIAIKKETPIIEQVRSREAATAAAAKSRSRVVKQEIPEEEEEMVYPVVLYRMHCEIVTLLVEGDPFVTPKDIGEWTHMSNKYEHVELAASGLGDHTKGLLLPENNATVMDIIARFCAQKP